MPSLLILYQALTPRNPLPIMLSSLMPRLVLQVRPRIDQGGGGGLDRRGGGAAGAMDPLASYLGQKHFESVQSASLFEQEVFHG